MNINERSLATLSTMNTQGSSGATANASDEQAEPTSTLSFFALDYKK
jgi:hypothetical protein